ncbi:MAG: DUF3426 domain-containing protein [Azoarcus sp.]|jgi:predicted Zn finger-like uncharacterized protein|nr:DUF3426 domain-containing protein [Azoarcus sp.]
MLTRCPSCQTVFRLTSEQLLARQGRVRCGSCLHPFNALDHLAESDPKAGQPAAGKASTLSAQPGSKPDALLAEPALAAKAKTAPEAPQPFPTLNDRDESKHLPPSIDITASATPHPRPVFTPVVKKTSQRLLSELDFSSSLDTKSRMPGQTPPPFPIASLPPMGKGEPDTTSATPKQNAAVAEEAPPAPPARPEAIPVPIEIAAPPAAPPSAQPEAGPQADPRPKSTLSAAEPPTPAPTPTPTPTPAPTPPDEIPFLTAAKSIAPAIDSAPPAAAPPPVIKTKTSPPAAPAPAMATAHTPDGEDSIFSQIDDMPSIEHDDADPLASVLFTTLPDDEDSIFSQMDMPRATRGRDKDKRTKRGKYSKPAARSKPPLSGDKETKDLASEFAEHDIPGHSAGEAADKGAPDKTPSKVGLEAKIDKIEAEIDAERKTTRRSRRNQKEAADEAAGENAGHRAGSHFDIYGRPMTKRERIAWTSVVAMLGVVLVIQAAFLFRHSIARSLPGMRPAFVSLCNTFGCAMPLPRDMGQIRIDDYGVLRQNDRPDSYVFYAKVSNRADFIQDWPNIELTLLDITNKPLVRRVITPEEWMPPEQRNKEGIAPRSDIDVRMDLEVVGIDPSNFRVGGFYP